MRIALVQCPVWGTREPPLALVQLSGCLKARGHNVRSFDLNNRLYRLRSRNFENLWAWEQSSFWYDQPSVAGFFSSIETTIDALCGEIMSFSPRMVGFSVTASTYAASAIVAQKLKMLDPQCLIVFGGQGFMDPRAVDRAFSGTVVDYLLPADGDQIFPALADVLESGRAPSSCLGIFARAGDRGVYTGDAAPALSLDAMPYMDFTDLRVQDYDDTRHLLVMASRGCVWRCSFCSSRTFWGAYRYMSGERIHQEIAFHKSMLPADVRHIDFGDLAFNGNMERVRTFSELMVAYPPVPDERMYWLANAIIHPALTPGLLGTMAAAGCTRLIFGIESGSPAVLARMHKQYDPAVAVRVIRDAHAAGISVTCNFMFGLPGETEEDFELTLSFLRAIAPFVDRVYPSRTYCAVEEHSDLHRHPETYGISVPVTHHLYWESTDKTNTYPVRLRRCQRFETLCNDLGVTVDCGVKTAVHMDEWFNLGHYYEHEREYERARAYFGQYAAEDPHNEIVSRKLRELDRHIARGGAR